MNIKNTFKLILNRIRRKIEKITLSTKVPDSNISFYIVSPFYNSSGDTIKCLESVYYQDFPKNKVKHIVIDDSSTDNSAKVIEQWLRKHNDNCVNFIKNEKRQGLCANNHMAFLKAPKNSIVLMLDGDDWLANNDILSYLAKIYSDKNIWLSYNTWISSDKQIIGSTRKITKKAIAENSFRKAPWTTSHLKAFRAELYTHVPQEYLIDPQTNTWWEKASDRAFFLSFFRVSSNSYISLPQNMLYLQYW